MYTLLVEEKGSEEVDKLLRPKSVSEEVSELAALGEDVEVVRTP